MDKWFETASLPAQIAGVFALSAASVIGTFAGFATVGAAAYKWNEYQENKKKTETEDEQA